MGRRILKCLRMHRLFQSVHQVVNSMSCLPVCRVHIPVYVSVGDNLDLVSNVVENKQGVCQHQHRLRESLRISIGTGQSLKVASSFIAQVTDHAAVKSGES